MTLKLPFCTERSRFHRLHKARPLHLFTYCTRVPNQYRPLVNTAATSQCAGHGNKASVAGKSNFSPQSPERLWFPQPSIQRDTSTGGEALERDFKFYPPPSKESTNTWSIISNTPSCCGAQLFKTSGNFAFIRCLPQK